MSRIDHSIIGKRFGQLTVLEFCYLDARRQSHWLCECDCGNKTVVQRANLTSGGTLSCGCHRRENVIRRSTTHGESNTPLYYVWHSMHQRCNNTNHKFYPRYGGRGIKVCDEWGDFEPFRDWALDSGYESGLTLDRECNDSGYYPENCRWVPQQTQVNNRSITRFVTYNGDTRTIAEWARLLHVSYNTLLTRINRNDMRDFEKYFGER